MRVGVAGFSHKTNTFTHGLTTVDEFVAPASRLTCWRSRVTSRYQNWKPARRHEGNEICRADGKAGCHGGYARQSRCRGRLRYDQSVAQPNRGGRQGYPGGEIRSRGGAAGPCRRRGR